MSRFTRIRGNRKELDVRLYSANRYKEGPLDRGGQGSRVGKSTACVEIGKLIESGYMYRRELLKNPDIESVNVALMGTHLVLTAYKKETND